MPGLGYLERGKIEEEWAVTELQKMMPEQSLATAVGATLEEREMKAMQGSEQLST